MLWRYKADTNSHSPSLDIKWQWEARLSLRPPRGIATKKGPGMRVVRSNYSIPFSRESEVKYPAACTEITTLALVSTSLHLVTLLSDRAVRHRMHRHDAASYLNSLNQRLSDISKTGHAQKQYLIWHKRTSYWAMSRNVFVAFAYMRSSVGIIIVKCSG